MNDLNKTIVDIGAGLPVIPDFRPGKIINLDELDIEEVGAGVRHNAGKLRVDLIPCRVWVGALSQAIENRGDYDWEDKVFVTCMKALAYFQEGDYDGRKLLAPVPHPWFDQAAAVMAYGLVEYRPYNWLKGQMWSVPLGAAIRHAKAYVLDGEHDDPSSGLSHIGHFVCNLVMLAMFADTYPGGNDFPDKKYFGVKR